MWEYKERESEGETDRKRGEGENGQDSTPKYSIFFKTQSDQFVKILIESVLSLYIRLKK